MIACRPLGTADRPRLRHHLLSPSDGDYRRTILTRPLKQVALFVEPCTISSEVDRFLGSAFRRPWTPPRQPPHYPLQLPPQTDRMCSQVFLRPHTSSASATATSTR